MPEDVQVLLTTSSVGAAHLEGFPGSIPDLVPLVLHDVQQAAQQLGQVTQKVHVRHAGQERDPANEEHALLQVHGRQVLPQLGDELVHIKVGAGSHNVLQDGAHPFFQDCQHCQSGCNPYM